MSKTRKTITIDSNLAEIVDQRAEFNLSGFVNRCLEQHFAGQTSSSPEMAALKSELERVEEELADLDSQRERLHQEREQIEERLEDTTGQEPELMDQAREALAGTPRDPTNPAIQNWASKLGITPDQLVQELDVESASEVSA